MTLFGNWVFANGRVRMRLSGWVLIHMTGVFTRRDEDTDVHRVVTMRGHRGGCHLQAKGHLRPPDWERGLERILPGDFRGSAALLTP